MASPPSPSDPAPQPNPRRRAPATAVVIGAAVLIGAGAMAATRIWGGGQLIAGDPDIETQSVSVMRAAIPAGASAFSSHCASCHGANAKGDGHGTPDLTDHDWLYGEGKASDIERVVLHGIRAADPKTWKLAYMPAFAKPLPYPREPTLKPLAPQDIRDATEFLISLEGKPADAAAAARGRALYNDRGGCYDCHANDAHGDAEVGGPDLADSIWLYGGDRATIFRSIAEGRAGYCPAWAARLSPVTIRRIALYVYSLSHPSSGGAKHS